jgi:hypothetical protein
LDAAATCCARWRCRPRNERGQGNGSSGKWQAWRASAKIPHITVLDFRYDVIQLNRLDWRDFMRNPNPLATALMTRMHIAPAERALVKLQCLRLMVTQQLDPARSHLIISFVEAYLALTEEEQQGLQTDIERLPMNEKERIMEYTNQWIEQGRREATLLLLKQLIVKRFGAITPG